jgi:tetratricopeptide (TPR) repeat protein
MRVRSGRQSGAVTDFVAEIERAVENIDDASYEYERALTRVVTEADDTFEALVRAAFENGKASADQLYALFYALNIYYRRTKQFSSLTRLLTNEGDAYRNRATYPHLRALYCAATRQQEEAFRCANAAREKAPEHAGVLHHYAETIIDREGAKDSPSLEMLKNAEEALDAALAQTGGTYARHYGTQARLYILRGEFDAAEAAADRAIDLEDRASKDFPIRIGEYEAIKLEGRFARGSRLIADQQQQTLEHLEEVRRSVEGSRSDALQLLGLLAAVIAFVVGTTSIAARLQNFSTSGRLLVLFTGSVLVIYAGFGAVYTRGLWRYLLVMALGLGIGAYSLFWWQVS